MLSYEDLKGKWKYHLQNHISSIGIQDLCMGFAGYKEVSSSPIILQLRSKPNLLELKNLYIQNVTPIDKMNSRWKSNLEWKIQPAKDHHVLDPEHNLVMTTLETATSWNLFHVDHLQNRTFHLRSTYEWYIEWKNQHHAMISLYHNRPMEDKSKIVYKRQSKI